MAEAATGAKPRDGLGEVQAAGWVRDMFSAIAPRYDLLNHLLSFNVDRGWRAALIRSLHPALAQPEAKILDLCCGTGDVFLELRGTSPARIFGADFCHPMLVSASRKAKAAGVEASLFEGDALSLPLRNNSLNAISIAFGFRNLANYAGGLDELHRVLKPGGLLSILEFSHPGNAFVKAAYNLYSRVALPAIGALVSGSADAYSYLPESIRRFPSAESLREMLQQAGFEKANYQLLTGGIAALHTAVKS